MKCIHVTEVKSKKVAFCVIGFWIKVSKPYFIYQFNIGISSFNGFLYMQYLQTPPHAKKWVWHKWPFTVQPNTEMNLSNIFFSFLRFLNYITFWILICQELKVLQLISCIWMQNISKCFPVLQKTKNIALTFTILDQPPPPSPLSCLDLNYFSPP